MLWLDSSYPPEKAGQPGGDRGDCPQDSGVPADVEKSLADVSLDQAVRANEN
jgi:cellulose 1,4-beta-cellobiosidase